MIPYTYEITHVSAENNHMEIIFHSAGRDSITVGARLPKEGENLDDLVLQYAPFGIWIDRESKPVIPAVGTTGSYTPPAMDTVKVQEPSIPTEEELAAAEAERQRIAEEERSYRLIEMRAQIQAVLKQMAEGVI